MNAPNSNNPASSDADAPKEGVGSNNVKKSPGDTSQNASASAMPPKKRVRSKWNSKEKEAKKSKEDSLPPPMQEQPGGFPPQASSTVMHNPSPLPFELPIILSTSIPPAREKLSCKNGFQVGHLSREEKNYIESLPENKKNEILKKMKSAAPRGSDIPLRFRVLNSNLSNKYEIFKKLQYCESSKYETWVENALSLPIGVFSKLPPLSTRHELTQFLQKSRSNMDSAVFGQFEAKDEIIRLLCQWAVSGCVKSFAIGMEGPPGIGKTTFAKNAIANAMHRPFCFIGVGGASDAAILTGHSFTYEGAICGRIAECLQEAKTMDPVIYIDELDKISKTSRGDELANVLVHLTDKEQNDHFRDRYFHGINIDLSKAIFVFSYNDASQINPVLLDRLNIIKMQTPSIDAKIEICKQHLIPRSLKNFNMDEKIVFSNETIKNIISTYTNEPGVRGLDKIICKIVNTVSVGLCSSHDMLSAINLELKEVPGSPFEVSNKVIDSIIGSAFERKGSHVSLMYT